MFAFDISSFAVLLCALCVLCVKAFEFGLPWPLKIK